MRYFYRRAWVRSVVAFIDRCGAALSSRRLPRTQVPARLVVLKGDNLGDVLLGFPTLAALRKALPGSHVTVVCSKSALALLSATGFADHLIGVAPPPRRRRQWGAAVPRLLRRVAVLRRLQPDAVVDLEANPLNLLAMRIAGVRTRVGFENAGLGFLLTRRFDIFAVEHRSDALLQVLDAFDGGAGGAGGAPWSRGPIPLRIGPELPEGLRGVAPRSRGWHRRLVALHPYAGCQSKQWPIEYWQVLCAALQEADFVPVLLGTAAEAEAYGRVAPSSGRPAIDLVGATSTRQLAAALSVCDLMIGNDSGPVHLAAGLGVPTLVIFSAANSPRMWAPRGAHVRVLHAPPPCAMCERTYCSHRSCLRTIRPNDVLREMQVLLEHARRPVSPTLAVM